MKIPYCAGRRARARLLPWRYSPASAKRWRPTYSRLPMGKDLKESNVTVIGDTCVDQPCWGFLRGKRLLTDSPKCCYYTARRELNFSVMPLARCLDAALGKEAECDAG